MSTRPGVVVTVCVLLAISAGCMKIDVTADVTDDGSGEFTSTIVLGSEIVGMITGMGGTSVQDLEEEIRSDMAASGGGADVEVTERDGDLVITASVEFSDTTELAGLLTTPAAGEDAMFESFDLVHDAGTWTLSAKVATSLTTSTTGTDGVGMSEEDTAEFEQMMGGALTEPEATFTLTFPAKVTESNATTVDTNTARWDLTSLEGSELTATAQGTASSNTVVLVLVGLTLVGLIGGAVLAWTRATPAKENTSDVGDQPEPVEGLVSGTDGVSQPTFEGWFPDPAGGLGLRYWDGSSWTEHTR